jgi:hypothetical protein
MAGLGGRGAAALADGTVNGEARGVIEAATRMLGRAVETLSACADGRRSGE